MILRPSWQPRPIPIDPRVCESGDAGIPIVYSNPDSPVSKAFISAAEKLAAQISIRNLVGEAVMAPGS